MTPSPVHPVLISLLLLAAGCVQDAAPDGIRLERWDESFLPGEEEKGNKRSTVAIFPGWPQEGVFGLRAPETIKSQFGLLFIDHEPKAPRPLMKPVGETAWSEGPDGALSYTVELDGGIRFGMDFTVTGDARDEVEIHGWLTNGTERDLSRLDTQFCLVNRGVEAFDERRGEQSFILIDGELVSLASTSPFPEDAPREYVLAYTAEDPGKPPAVPNSWAVPAPASAPLVVTVSAGGTRWIGLAFDRVKKLMSNCLIPCIHADPAFPDAPAGATVHLEGRLYAGEGPLDELLSRFYEDFPRWKPKD